MRAFAILPKSNTPEDMGCWGDVFERDFKLWFQPEDKRLKAVEVERADSLSD